MEQKKPPHGRRITASLKFPMHLNLDPNGNHKCQHSPQKAPGSYEAGVWAQTSFTSRTSRTFTEVRFKPQDSEAACSRGIFTENL